MTAAADPPPPRPPRAGLIGPLFRWELVRLARRGQDARARGILALVILTALMLFTLIWFDRLGLRGVFFGTAEVLSIEESSRFGSQFAMTFLVAQLIVMIILTPAYAAGGLAEEKERRTFDFLLTSGLSDREIILGKFLGRLVFLLGVMFAGLPILSLTLLYGGVDPELLFATYALTAGTVAVIAAASLLSAVMADSFRGAMFRAYGLAFLFAFVGFGCYTISPIFMFVALQQYRSDPPVFYAIAFGYPFVEFVIAVLLVLAAVRWLRPKVYRSQRAPAAARIIARPVRTDAAEDGLPVARPVETPVAVPVRGAIIDPDEFQALPVKPKPPLTDDDDPFLWKERYTSLNKSTSDEDSITGLKLTVLIIGVIGLGFLTLIGLASLLSGQTGAERTLMIAGTIGSLFQALSVGAVSCGLINRERNRLTLESLLSIPRPRSDILKAKYFVPTSRGIRWGIVFHCLIVLALLGSDVPLAALAAAAYYLVANVTYAVVGLWCSMIRTSTARAMMLYLPIGGVISLVPTLVWAFTGPGENVEAFLLILGSAAIVATLGGLIWLLLNRAFERDGGGLDGARA